MEGDGKVGGEWSGQGYWCFELVCPLYLILSSGLISCLISGEPIISGWDGPDLDLISNISCLRWIRVGS